MFITAEARRGDAVAALGLLREMKNERVPVTVRTFSAAMDACLRANNPDLALALSAEMKRGGIEPDEVRARALCLLLSVCLSVCLSRFGFIYRHTHGHLKR